MIRFWMFLVTLLASQLCAAGGSVTRNRTVECYGDNGGWTTRAWTQQCYTTVLPGGLTCSDSLTACGVQNPPVNTSASNNTLLGSDIGIVKYQSTTSPQVCGRVIGSQTHCWIHSFNGTQTTLSYQGNYPDKDGDVLIDSNDLDDDQDGIPDTSDNCPLSSNANQLNTDADAQGNACDTDDDNDGVADVSDAFPLNAAESADRDSDGIGNNADMDDDGDGVPDYIDANPLDSVINTESVLPLGGIYEGSALSEGAGVQ